MAGLFAVGCFTPSVTAEDPIPTTKSPSSHQATSDDSDGTNADTTGNPIAAPPVTAGNTTTTTVTSDAPVLTPGSASDAGTTTSTTTTTAADAGAPTCTAGKISATGYGQKPSRAAQATACSASDVAYYDGLAASGTESLPAVQTAMQARNATCASCMFSNYADTTWGLFVMENTTAGFVNWAPCYANALGGNDKCGAEVQQYYDCLNDVCHTCTDATSVAACKKAAAADKSSCGGLTFTDCGDLTSLNQACSTFNAALTSVCGGGGD